MHSSKGPNNPIGYWGTVIALVGLASFVVFILMMALLGSIGVIHDF